LPNAPETRAHPPGEFRRVKAMGVKLAALAGHNLPAGGPFKPYLPGDEAECEHGWP